MNGDEISIFLKKVEEYISLAIEKEEKKEYDIAKKYYLMAAKAILEIAKKSPIELKKSRMEKAEKLIQRANSLPSAVIDEKGEEKVVQLLEKPKITFNDVAGLEEVKEKIKDLIITPFLYPEIAKKWKVRTGGGVLLYGPPGTGKTLLAKAVAGELDADFFYIKASDIMSKWVGESEKKVANLFQKARETGKAVIFIDEIDALLPKRTGTYSTVMKRVVPQFLAEMDGIDSKNDKILLMAATNVPWELDPAVLRPGRFDFKFYIPLPDFEAREKIFELNLDIPKEENFDFDLIAQLTEGYSGADIRLICDEAKRKMFRREIEGKENILKTEYVIEIIDKIKPSVNEKMLKKYEEFSRMI
ncbi:MAG TPA: ATP-binding protein [Thermoplasmata archaeon]|nr:ATP-binding protein [Thermoplasmata archaeon]